METVAVVTRDVNGKRICRYSTWDNICDCVNKWRETLEEEEILLVYVDRICIYSGLQDKNRLSWGDLLGFFA